MRRILLLLLLASPACAQTPILLALRAQAWPAAKALAQAEPEPLAPILVDFIRLLNPGQASATELSAFMAAHPVWPDRPVLERRYGEALAEEADAAVAADLCRAHPPQAPQGLLRCAEAYSLRGDAAAAARAARSAWVTGLSDPAEASAFLARWPNLATQADDVARFEHLLPADSGAARRQLARLDQPARALAAARLALRQEDAEALGFVAAVPEGLRATPALLLAEARFLRRTHDDAAALALWRTALPAAEAALPAAARAPYWTERDALARRLLDSGDAKGAYGLADGLTLAPDQAVDAEFLAGWIALRRLNDAGKAGAHFQALAAISHSAITQARAQYWLGRATADPATAKRSYTQAAAWPLTYYGQLAARAAGTSEADLRARIAAQLDPVAPAADEAAFLKAETTRAAVILAGWGDGRRGVDFLNLAIQPPADLNKRAMVARLAQRLGLPDVAVQAARLAGRDGGVLAVSGWPAPFTPPAGTGPRALYLAVMRQESSFDPAVTSAAGAQGLMQMMPPTAGALAKALGVAAAPLADPDINMRLGVAYLGQLSAQFPGCEACAVAAYNAGPRRVREWIETHGTPGDVVDWIEMIPFGETRNYVQRVLEAEEVYGAR